MKTVLNIGAQGLVMVVLATQAIAQDSGVADAMIAEGAPAALAKCLVAQLGDDAERLFAASDDELTEDDTAQLVSALEACSDVDTGE